MSGEGEYQKNEVGEDYDSSSYSDYSSDDSTFLENVPEEQRVGNLLLTFLTSRP